MTVNEAKFLISGINSWNDLISMKSLMYMKGLGERLPPKVLDHFLYLAQDFAATVIPWDMSMKSLM